MTENTPFPKDHSLQYFIKSLVAGGVAGCLAKTLTAPLDRVKILFQGYNPVYIHHSGTPFGVFKAVRQIYHQHGYFGLFQGHSAMLLRIFPSAAIRFMSYEQFRMILIPDQQHNTPLRHFLAGSLAGNIAVMVTYPLEIIRTRLAYEIRHTETIPSHRRNHPFHRSHSVTPYGIIHTCKTVYAENGNSIKGFYKGFAPTMLGIVPYAGAAFMSYQYMKDICLSKYEWTGYTYQDKHGNDKRKLNVWVHLLVGGLAGMCGQTVAYPLDTIRHRMQLVGIAKNIPVYKGLGDALATILRKEGLRGFFIGLTINYWKTMPANAVAFVTYEQMKQWLQI